LRYRDRFPQLGRTLAIETPIYNASGPIRDIGEESRLEIEDRQVVISDITTTSNALAIRPGETLEIAGSPVATIESIQTYERGDPGQIRVLAGLTLKTVNFGQQAQFGDTTLRRGATIPLQTDGFSLAGQVERVGTASLDRETRQVLVSDELDLPDAQAITPGDTYRVAGRTVATVESVQLYNTANPDRVRIFAGLALNTTNFGERSRFGETPLQEGATLPFRTDAYTLNGRIERLDALEQRGAATNRRVTLLMSDVPPTRAEMIEEGMTDRAGDETAAELLDVRREPSPIVLTSDGGNIFLRDHPLNQDIQLTASLAVRETTNGVRFKGGLIQRGSDITLAFGDTTIRATVVGL
jgi:hypothetical protein